jgi:ribosomal protein L4
LNIFDLINNEKVVMTKDMIAKIEEVLWWWKKQKHMT